MDFAAWFEAYIGGGWYTFDARNNLPRIGRGLIACGRDDAAVAIATTFGPNTLENFRVWTDEVESFDAASVARTNHPRTCHAPPANFAPPGAAFAPGPGNFRKLSLSSQTDSSFEQKRFNVDHLVLKTTGKPTHERGTS
jgi:hypothetical protein